MKKRKAAQFESNARSYLEAGKIIANSNKSLIKPPYYLLGHSIELALKGFLVIDGKTIEELKNIRHNLSELVELCKEETVNKWMRRDEAKDEKLKEATPPEKVICDTCSADMTYKDKTLDTSDPNQVMFFFKCPNNHLPHKYVYNDGTVWRKDPVLCPECDSELEESSTKDDKKIVTEYNCPDCSYSDTDTINLETDEPEEDPHFAEDRDRFCLSREAGEKYRSARSNFERVRELATKWEDEKEHEEEKERADAIERLTVPHIKRKMSALFEERNLEEVKFDDLEVSPKSTYLKFSVEDPEATKENQRGRCLDLKKKIVSELEDTNWRLMSDGISNRLGILSGRLRVYEDDDEIYELIKRESNLN